MTEQAVTLTTEAPLPEWDAISESGGVDGWVRDELRQRGLLDEDVDTSTLSQKARKKFKARREEERRVRRILQKHGWSAYRRAHLVHLGAGIFHHDTSDIDRFDIADPERRIEENELPKIADAKALADALGMTMRRMRWLSFHREVDTGTHYIRWTVPKRSGGTRLISAPKPELKAAQSWIARHITEHLPVHGAAHGFLAGRSTVTNATRHAGAKVVIKFDLKDFYPTVTTKRVKGMFRKAGFGEQAATVLSLLTTESPREEIVINSKTYYVANGPRSLPQGAPTSPSITNAICLRLDRRLSGLAKKMGFRYTRYADDLTFSWHDDKPAPVGKLFGAVDRITRGEGFELHPNKTRVMRSGRRQKVTGLVINAEGDAPSARVPRRTVRQLRAAIKNREDGKPGKGETLDALEGLAAYVYMCDPKRGRALLDRVRALKNATESGSRS